MSNSENNLAQDFALQSNADGVAEFLVEHILPSVIEPAEYYVSECGNMRRDSLKQAMEADDLITNFVLPDEIKPGTQIMPRESNFFHSPLKSIIYGAILHHSRINTLGYSCVKASQYAEEMFPRIWNEAVRSVRQQKEMQFGRMVEYTPRIDPINPIAHVAKKTYLIQQPHKIAMRRVPDWTEIDSPTSAIQ